MTEAYEVLSDATRRDEWARDYRTVAEAAGLVVVTPQAQILLETATLQLLATVVDLEYGRGPLPADSYFERITLELAIWPRQG